MALPLKALTTTTSRVAANSNALSSLSYLKPALPNAVRIAANDNFKRMGMAKANETIGRAIVAVNAARMSLNQDLRIHDPLMDNRVIRELDFQPARMERVSSEPFWVPDPSLIPDSDPEPIDPSFFTPEEWRRFDERRRIDIARRYGDWVNRQRWRENIAREQTRLRNRDRVALCIRRKARRRALGAAGYFLSKANRRSYKPVRRTWRSDIIC